MKEINVENIDRNIIKYIIPYRDIVKWEMTAQDSSTITLATNILSVNAVV